MKLLTAVLFLSLLLALPASAEFIPLGFNTGGSTVSNPVTPAQGGLGTGTHVGTTGVILQGNGSGYTDTPYTVPTTAGAAGLFPIWNGTNLITSPYKLPTTVGSSGTIPISNGTDLVSRVLIAGDLPSTAVTPGAYTSANITIDQQGRITLAANGSSGMTNPMTTTGDVITSSSGSTPARIAAVAAGSHLRSAGTSTQPIWSTLILPNAGTTGDIPYVSSTNVITMLPKGADTNVLTLASGVPTWAAPSSGMTNPMTTTGDLITSSSGSTPDRIAAVAAGSVLRSAGTSTEPAWSTFTIPNTFSAGAIVVATSANVLGQVAASAGTGSPLLAVGGAAPAYVGYTIPVAIPAAGKPWKSNGTDMVASSNFGGDGQDSVVTWGAATFSKPQVNATVFSQTVSTTSTTYPVIINCFSTATFNGTLKADNTVTSAAHLSSPYDAPYGFTANCGGGGGANPVDGSRVVSTSFSTGHGGNGLVSTAGAVGCSGGRGGSVNINTSILGQNFTDQFVAPAGSGSPGFAAIGILSNVGGYGGCNVAVSAIGAINVASTATFTFTGQAGATGTTGGGGGGGAAGCILLASQTSVATNASATYSFVGGNGGAGSTLGGGGGGGMSGAVIRWSPTNTGAATVTSTAATGGAAAGTTTAGQNGQTGGLYSFIGTPNLPLVTWFHNGGHKQLKPLIDTVRTIALVKGEDPTVLDFGESQGMMAAYAANGDIVKYCQIRSERSMFTSQEPTVTAPYCLDMDSELLKNAS